MHGRLRRPSRRRRDYVSNPDMGPFGGQAPGGNRIGGRRAKRRYGARPGTFGLYAREVGRFMAFRRQRRRWAAELPAVAARQGDVRGDGPVTALASERSRCGQGRPAEAAADGSCPSPPVSPACATIVAVEERRRSGTSGGRKRQPSNRRTCSTGCSPDIPRKMSRPDRRRRSRHRIGRIGCRRRSSRQPTRQGAGALRATGCPSAVPQCAPQCVFNCHSHRSLLVSPDAEGPHSPPAPHLVTRAAPTESPPGGRAARRLGSVGETGTTE